MMDSCAACGFFGLPPGEAVRCPSCGELARVALPPLDRKIGRNEPCPCGSGSKFKRCHGDGRS